MSPQHQKLLTFIKAHLSWAGYSPSRADMERELGVGPTRINTLLSELVDFGVIERPQKGVYVPTAVRERSNFRPAGPDAPSLSSLLAGFSLRVGR